MFAKKRGGAASAKRLDPTRFTLPKAEGRSSQQPNRASEHSPRAPTFIEVDSRLLGGRLPFSVFEAKPEEHPRETRVMISLRAPCLP